LNFPTVNVGGTITRQLSLQNTGGLTATVSAVTIQPAGAFAVLSGVPAQIAAGSGASFDVRFNPQSEGVFSATACFIITAPCPDTVCVTLNGEGVQGTLEVQPPLLAFGTRAQCQSITLFDTLRNTGSGPITILSANITGASAAAFTNLTPVTAPEQILAGGRRIFDIRFNPALVAGDGPVTAALRINTDDAVLPSFDIPLEAVRVTLRADAGGTIDFGPVEVGNPVDRTVTLRNNGSVPLCYSMASIPAGITVLPAPPFCIDPGMTRDITVTLSATETGNYRSDLTLFVDDPCTDSTHFALRGQAQEGALSQPDTIDIGIIPWCENPSVDFDIVSTYLEAVTLESMRLEGPDASFVTIVNPTASALPLTIPGGSAEQVTIRFIPDQRTHTFTATLVSTFTAFGSPIERKTVLTGRAVVPELTVGNASFPTTVIGQSGGRIVVRIENTGEIPVHVDGSVTWTFDFLARSVTPPYPLTLQPGQSIDVEVEFLPQNPGSLVDSLTVSSDAPCVFFASGRLEGEAIPQPIVDVTLSVNSIQGEADRMIDIPILVDQNLGPAEITQWSGSLSFNRTMLHPLEVVTEGTLSAAMDVAMQYDNATGTVSLTASGARVGDGSGTLVIVRCLVLIGNDVTTRLNLSDAFAFDDGYARIIGRESGRFDLVNYCLPGERLVSERPGFVLDQNRPNPVSQSTRPVTTISYVLPEEMTLTLDLYDMIGRRIRRIDEGQRTAGLHTVNLSVDELQPGTYIYVLRSTQQTAVRRMVIVR
jgi:hypothetical protein